jgi:PAS domain S-box-containing protein
LVRKKILLVEDDGIEAMDIKRTLESFDYEVPYVASSGGEAIKKALEIQPDLILMDIVLKGEINGIDAAHKIKELSIPLIYLTAHSEDSTVQKAKFTEPYGYIIKPYDSSELKYAIELALYKSKMEKRLKESEMRYRFIVEAANEGIWSMGADFNTTYVNQKMAEMLGYNAEEMLGKPVTSFMFEEDIPDHEEHIKSRLEGVSENYERRLKHKDGSEVFTLVAATVLKDINGNFNGSFGMFTDITHRKEMEKQLNDSTSQLFHIIDNSPILQFVIDKNHRVLYWNQAMASYSGISPEEIIGTDQHWKAFYNGKRPCLADLILDGDILPVEKWYSGKYKESEYLKGVYEVEDYFPSMGETGKWLHFTAAPIKDSEGKIIWVLETLEDITERKKAEYALRESEEKFRVLAENAPVSIVVYQDDKTVYVNDYAAKISGYSKEELYVMNFWDAFHPDDQKLIKRRGKARLRGAEVSKKYEVRYITKSGELRYIVLSAGKIIYGGKPAVLAILVDITEHKIVENRLKKSEECLMMGMGMAKLVYWEYDIKNDLFTFDDQFYSLYGTSTKQEGGNKMSSQEYANRFVPTEERALVGEEVAKALETDDPNYSSAIQHSIIRSDGERRFIIVRIRMLLDDNGQKIGTRGVNQDITELILAEEKLARSESKYRAIFDNIKSAVAVYNAIDGGSDFVFKDFNHAAEEIEKIKMENVVGKKVTEVFPAVVEFGLMEVFKRVWETGKPEKHPVSIYKDERIGGWRENYVYKLPSDDIVAVYDDLTEIKQYEEELEQNQNRLRSLVRILQYRAESVQDFLDYAVEEAIGLTGSKIGYIYHYHEEREEFILNTWSKDVMDECSITDQPTVYKLEKTGIWGEAVRQRKPIMLNDFQAENPLKKGYPKGHAPIHKFMTLPLFAGGKIVAVVGMANKETNYTETDILQLELLMDGVWKVVDTQRAEEALKKSEIRYRAIFENTGTATAISEDNTILSLVNEEFANLTGFSKRLFSRIGGEIPRKCT